MEWQSVLTFFLALGYAPVYAALAKTGGALLDDMLPMPADAKALPEWQTKRTALNQFLGIQAGSVDNLKAALSTLAPLVGSILTVIVGDGKP